MTGAHRARTGAETGAGVGRGGGVDAAARGVDVTVRAVGVVVGGSTVLDGVDAAFASGSLTAVVGPSGSGKTTLLTVLGRHWPPSSGQVEFAAADGGAPRISLVFQAFALLSLLTAVENVELAGQVRGDPRGRIRAKARACLAQVGLADRADHLVEELSGGEQQRVALARALMTDPQLLLADEPTAQLDPLNRERVIDLLRSLADAGTTVVVGTHDPEVAARCDAIVRLDSGRRAD